MTFLHEDEIQVVCTDCGTPVIVGGMLDGLDVTTYRCLSCRPVVGGRVPAAEAAIEHARASYGREAAA